MWKSGRVLACILVLMFINLPVAHAPTAIAACAGHPGPPEGTFSWPAAGPVTTGWSLDCVSDRGHRGIDIATSGGDEIRAAADGTVAFAGYTPAEGGGLTLAISHEGGLRSTYLHLETLLVAPNQQVARGDVIATSDGSPLHFGVKLSGAGDGYLNPLELLPPAGIIETADLPLERVSEAALPQTPALPAPPASATSPSPASAGFISAPAVIAQAPAPSGAPGAPAAAHALEPYADQQISTLAAPAVSAVLPGSQPAAFRTIGSPTATIPPFLPLPAQAAVNRAAEDRTSSQLEHTTPPDGILSLGAGLSLVMAAAGGGALLAGRQPWPGAMESPPAAMPLLD